MKKDDSKIIQTWLIRAFFVAAVILSIKALFSWFSMPNRSFTPPPFDMGKETDYYTEFIDMKEGVSFVGKSDFARDIFIEQKETEQSVDILVKEILFAPLILKYMGFIERDNGDVIAQINFGQKTFFVKVGDKVDTWVIVGIEKDKVIVLGVEGEEKRLPIREKVFSSKPYAVLSSKASGKSQKLYIGDSFEQYKVLDIKDNTVILNSESGTLTLNK